MTTLTYEQYAKRHSHTVYYIDSYKRLSYADYTGTEDECRSILRARLAGKWAMVENNDQRIHDLYETYISLNS